jgi:hypothetical protein
MKTICVLASVILALISGAMGAAAQSHGVHGQGHDILHYWYQTLSDKRSVMLFKSRLPADPEPGPR